ncbi:response regulator [Kitasatospora azatica]|uniref:response regulator n=1 Tax=Kitasatospora azatica TaxID=58347 RepID=UPI000563F866|nr:response regulator transcription factor [Kitasatospora azatica]
MSLILLVEDEPQILRALRINLRARRYSVLTASTGQQALDSVSTETPDAVLLDLGLPDFDGVDVLRGIRASLSAPIIVLSGRSELEEKIRALDAGADDYLTKPFEIDELFARLRAVLRRTPAEPPPPDPVIGELTVNITRGTVTGPHGAVRLTPTEWRILKLLLAAPGQLVPRLEILREVWGPEHEHHGNYLRVYFAGLRRKLEADPAHPRHLITEPGIGYRYQP